tara:strand:- start:160 stop:534 length:375 start_codon:yes stop_codon:yes gene_type:complete
MQKKTVSNKSALFAIADSTLHYIRVAPDSEEYLKVWIKEPTFLQLEKAQAKLINLNSRTQDISLEMDTLFRYLWEAFVEKTEPTLTTIEILKLNPYVGSQIKEILPDPFDMKGDENLKVDSKTP